MSRIGKKPIEIPAGVTLTINKSDVEVKGPKGVLNLRLLPEVNLKLEENKAIVGLNFENKNSPAFWGLTRALLANMVKGVSEGFEKNLELQGVGYRVKQSSTDAVTLTLGFSHPVEFKAPEGITLHVGENQTISIRGVDKQLVGLVAANIRKLRKPEPYKGKGIRYAGEVVRRKAGKTGKTGK
jgi:large subunit ribosomal protein L6